MKNLLSVGLLLSCVSIPVSAIDSEWFVSGGIGYQGQDVAYQVKGGVTFDKQHKLALEYDYSYYKNFKGGANKYNKMDQDLFLIEYDYSLPVSNKVKIFAGVTMGVLDAKYYLNESHDHSNDFIWGAQIGLNFDMSEQLSSSLTYRYFDDSPYIDQGLNNFESWQIMFGVAYSFGGVKSLDKSQVITPMYDNNNELVPLIIIETVSNDDETIIDSKDSEIEVESTINRTFKVQVFAGRRVSDELKKNQVIKVSDYISCPQLKLHVEIEGSMFRIRSGELTYTEALDFKKLVAKECNIKDAFIIENTN